MFSIFNLLQSFTIKTDNCIYQEDGMWATDYTNIVVHNLW